MSVALIRQMMWRMLGASHPMEAHRIDSRAMFHRGRGADVKEGIASFLEKRPAALHRYGFGPPAGPALGRGADATAEDAKPCANVNHAHS